MNFIRSLMRPRYAFGDHAEHAGSVEQCIRSCLECSRTCQETLSHCLSMAGVHVGSPHIRALLSCIEICKAAVSLMTLRVPFAKQLCAVCADVCDTCADSCRNFSDPVMKQCAQVCKRCAQMCRSM